MIERYTRPRMGRIWTLENRYRAWLAVELAICEAWAARGNIPAQAMQEIRAKADVDAERISRIEETTRHDVIAFLTSLEELVGPAARFIHMGATSSDIVDTAGALLVREAGEILLEDLACLLKTLESMARRYKGVPCMGRTHGVHAEPTSFGLKIAGYHAEFSRGRARLRRALKEMCVGKISGAVGTYTTLDPALEKDALTRLGLAVDIHSTQIVQRDRYAMFFATLAVIGGSIERLAVELRHLQRTELLEAEEGFARGQKGSSAMPHKKNPISAENLCGIARLLRGNAIAALEDQALWHERDISHSSVERVIMPDSTILLDYALARLDSLLCGLRVDPQRMLDNMGLSYGLYYAGRVLTALVEAGMGRQEAYELVQALAMRGWERREQFPELVRNDAEVRKHLDDSRLDAIFDLRSYLRHEDDIFGRVFAADPD